MTVRAITFDRHSNLPDIDRASRIGLSVDVVLTVAGSFVSAVDESAAHLEREFGYEVRQREDGARATGFPLNGLPSRLDILEAAGLRCAVISGRQGTRKLRHVVYVTGDQRDAPPQRSVEEILGLTASESTDPTGSDGHPPYAEVVEDATANAHDGDKGYLAVDVETCTADRLLDVRTELLAELWNRFLREGNASVLAGLQAAELLEHQAHLLASRPVRRRRDGDDRWTPELDDEIVGQYVSGRLIAEIARAVDRPTTLTSERLAELGYPGSLWPAWDADAESALQTMISRSAPLAEIARSLKRSPWDITTLLTRRSTQ